MRIDEISKYVMLTEVFDQPVSYDLQKDEASSNWYAYFDYNDCSYVVGFAEKENNIWVTAFTILEINGEDVSDRDWGIEKLNSNKSSIIVFSTVIAIIIDWIQKVSPTIFKIDVEEESIGELYNKIINYLENKIKTLGYGVTIDETEKEWIFLKYGATINRPKKDDKRLGQMAVLRLIGRKSRKGN
jgi:hypothetical protein